MWFGVGLGGNLPGTPAALLRAVRMLASDGRVRVRGVSRTFRTLPWGDRSPAYWNICLAGWTTLGARALFALLESAERLFHRRGKGRLWPRTLDADLLFLCPSPAPLPEGIVVPHPRLDCRPVLQVLLWEACQRGKIPFSASGLLYPPGHPLGPPAPAGYLPLRPFRNRRRRDPASSF